jgi:protein-tyrosine phosphatase
MIDIHSHLLFGLDEGAKNIQDTLEICRYLAENGFDTIVATPHIIPGLYNNTPEKILERLKEVTISLEEENINLKLLPGAEYYLDYVFYKNLSKPHDLMTLNRTGKYILVEFPMAGVPNIAKEIVFRIKVSGLSPVLAHPERYATIIEKPEKAIELHSMGFILQMNLGSLNGGYGSAVKKTAEKLLSEGIIYCVALDIHNIEQAKACVEHGISALRNIAGDDGVKTLLFENPSNLISG